LSTCGHKQNTSRRVKLDNIASVTGTSGVKGKEVRYDDRRKKSLLIVGDELNWDWLRIDNEKEPKEFANYRSMQWCICMVH
jgi:hypothetical protein